MPKVSVILTSRNHAAFIDKSIRSVLDQSYEDFELIIWDDASTDNSWSIIESYRDKRIRTFRNDIQRYGTYSVNKAISEVAVGEYIAIHHSDDVWELDKLEKQVKFLNAHPEFGAVFTWVNIIDDDGKTVEGDSLQKLFAQPNQTRHQWLRRFLFQGNALCHPSVLIRKQCYNNCGTYSHAMWQLPDFDMWVRLCLRHEIHVLPEPLVRFRWHGDGSNTSAPNPHTLNQSSFETYLILENYDAIDKIEDVVKILPEAEKFRGEGESDPSFMFAMAMLALQPTSASRLHAQKRLFKIISDPARAAHIKEIHNFDRLDFMEITGQCPLFAKKPDYQKTISPKSDAALPPLTKGIQAFGADNLADAIEYLSVAMAQEPENPLPPAYLAFICARQGLEREARDFIDQSAQIAPKRADLKAALGETFLKSGRPDRAADYLQEAIQIQPDLLAAYPALAQSLHLTGRSEEAVSLLQTASALPSESQATIQNVLLNILIERGDLSEFTKSCLRFSNNTVDDLLAVRCLARFEESGEQLLETLSRIQTRLADTSTESSEHASYCPVCDARNIPWHPLPDYYRQQSERHGFKYFDSGEMTALDTYQCPVCGASDRERLYAHFLRTALPANMRKRMLHFAPEAALSKYIRQTRYFDSYQTADMEMPGVDFQADLQSLPFDDCTCDFFICSHVLEHVSDDKKAIKELYRITKPGGCGLLMAPICLDIDKTIENPAITDEAMRWQLFGQNDHVRLYSHDDYVARIEESGFLLQQMAQDDFGAETFRQLGLKPTSILYVVRRP